MTKHDVDESMFVRERLIRGGIALIAEEGCSSLGVRRLAQASDRTTMCVYSKFGSRGGLLAAVYVRVADGLVAILESAVTAGDAYRDWARANAQLYILLFDQPLDALDVADTARRDLIGRLVALLPDGQNEWARLHGEASYERISHAQPARA